MFTNLLIFVCSLIFGFIIMLVGMALMKKSLLDSETLSSFECGFDSSTRSLFLLVYVFLLANIFLIFDVELILLYPALNNLILAVSWVEVVLFSVFIMFLALGLFHEWNQKMLEWVV